MRALFLSPNVPHPPENGGHHRNLGLIRALARFASVDVLAIGDPRDPRVAPAREHLAALGASLSVHAPTGPGPSEDDPDDLERFPDAAAHFRSPALADELSRRLAAARFDVVHVEEIVMAQYAGGLACPRVMDRQKVDWAYHAAMARVARARATAHLQEAARFLRWERRLAGAFDRLLVPGEGDRRLLEPLHGPGSVSVVPIAIGDDLRPPAGAVRRVDHALLYGARDYGPNVEAEQWFFREVWPRLRTAAPDMKVLIVGSGRPPLAAALPPADARVEARGFAPDTRPVLQAPGALVVGVQVGGGIRTKILEALACGMPVVSTAVGVENLGLVPGRDFLRAETAAEMADALARLHRDPGLASALAREGPGRVEAFRWSRVEPAVEAIYRDVLARASSRGPHPAAPPASHVAHFDSAEDARLVEEIDALRHRAGPGSPRARLRRLGRRLRRSAPVAAAERAALRLLDRRLAPASARRAAFLIVALAYAVSRLWDLAAIPAFVDESIHLLWAHDLRHGLGEALSAGRLLQVLACAIPVRWGPDPLWSARLVSVAMGGVALAAVLHVGRRLGGEWVGLAAAALYVACPFTLLYDRMALADVFCSAFACLTLLASLRAVEDPGVGRRAGLGLAMAGAMLSKLTALFVLAWPPCVLLGVPRPGRFARGWAWAYALAALLVAPALAYFLLTTAEIEQMAFTGGGLGDRLALLARNLRLGGEWLWVYWTPPVALLALAAALGAPWRRDGRTAAVLATAALVPVVSLGLVAGEWFPRYVLPATPPALVLAALALRDLAAALSKVWPRASRFGPGLLLGLACAPAVAFSSVLLTDPFRAPLPSLDREQFLTGWPSGYGFPEAVAHLRASVPPGRGMDIVVDQLEQTGPLYALRAAFMGRPEVRVEAADLESPQAPGRLLECARARACFVVVSAERLRPSRAAALAALPIDDGRTFTRPDGSVAVRVFRLAPADPVSPP